MSRPPARPKLYHITHVDNVGSIASGALLSDAEMSAAGGPTATIGMSTIKARRLALPVRCHPGTRVGEFGVRTAQVKAQVEAAMGAAAHRPPVVVQAQWYY